jgi:hypothetical protein
MSNERTDEFLKWRGLLDQPDARPDQVLDDREATWQKLADRLGERRRNRLSGYRIAAACLLFVLLIPAARLFQDHHGAAGIVRPRQQGRQLPPVSATAVRQQHVPAAAGSVATTGNGATTGNATTTGTAAKSATGATTGNATTTGSAGTSATAVSVGMNLIAKPADRRTDRNRLPLLANIRLSPAPIVAAPLDSASQSSLSQPSEGIRRSLSGMPPALRKKELKVVHQNEIRGGNTPSPAVSTTSTDRLINVLLRASRQQPSSVPPTSTEDPALLKIKLSPSN